MKESICIFGDSVTYGGYIKQNWVNLLRWELEEKLDDVVVYNHGINAETSTAILKRLESEANPRNPTTIIIAIGVNDSAYILDTNEAITSIDTFENNLQEIINKAKQFTERIFLLGLALGDDSLLKPFPESNRGKSYDFQRVKNYNQKIKEAAEENKCTYIPLLDALHKEDFSDGLHPNEQGHRKIFESIKIFFDESPKVI